MLEMCPVCTDKARRRRRHWPTATSTIDWSSCAHSSIWIWIWSGSGRSDVFWVPWGQLSWSGKLVDCLQRDGTQDPTNSATHVTRRFLGHVLRRVVNSQQDVNKMSDGHRNVVIRQLFNQLCRMRIWLSITTEVRRHTGMPHAQMGGAQRCRWSSRQCRVVAMTSHRLCDAAQGCSGAVGDYRAIFYLIYLTNGDKTHKDTV